MRKKIIISSVALAALCLVVAFNILAETRLYNFAKSGWEHSRLDDARAKWEKNGYTSYVMEVEAVSNFCLYDLDRIYSVLVINDQVISMHLINEPDRELYAPFTCQGRTITEMFRYIDSSISHQHIVRVEYDKRLGYPSRFLTDERGSEDAIFIWKVFEITPDLDSYADQQTREELIARAR